MDVPLLLLPQARLTSSPDDPASARGLLDWLCCAESGHSHQGLIVAAHSDDEVIGAGSRMPRLACSRFVHVTDGAPRNMEDARAHGFTSWEAYAQARRQEFIRALDLAGISARQAIELGYPDQESSFHLVELAQDLHQLILDLKPEFLLTHPYEGGHPDHDSTSFAVHSACRLLAEQRQPVPVILEFSSYHQGPDGIQAGEFLEFSPTQQSVLLSSQEKEMKRRMLSCFVTQQQVLNWFTLETERFRLAPPPLFSAAPHPGTLYYEQYPWGMDGARWRNLAAQAQISLGIRKEP